jgi:hypothetical protein
MAQTPAPPADLAPRGRGRALWREVHSAFELGAHEAALLHEACRTADQLDVLAAVLAAEGPLLPDGRVHPALVESRQLRLALARLIASLRIPEVPASRRPQRRGAVRGTYLKAVVGGYEP